jgi:arginase family enzyme
MMIEDFLQPVHPQRWEPKDGYYDSQFGFQMGVHAEQFPDLDDVQLAIIGVPDDRKALNNEGCAEGADKVRAFLYQLHVGDFHLKMADLGNIAPGETPRDTHVALKTVCEELMKQNILPIILGGGHDLTYSQYWAYQHRERKIDVVVFDSHFDLDARIDEQKTPDSISYLNSIILHEPHYLFNFSNIGYQTYYVNQQSIDLMNQLYFDIHRLGSFRNNIAETEPIIRGADMLSVDVSCIKMSDAPGNANAHPNGFYGEEICQMMRYAGISDKLSSLGIYEFNPKYDHRNQTAELVAQMIWCFIEGFYQRKNDLPAQGKNDFIKYRTNFEDITAEVVFLKSKKTDRWWMQIPYQNNNTKNERFEIIPCSYEDYQMATEGEIPERWWKNYQKLV